MATTVGTSGAAAGLAAVADSTSAPTRPKKRERSKPAKGFDMSKYLQRTIAIQYYYDGARYDGLAHQESSECTVEHELFKALRRTCLAVESPPPEYSRCGRTDKGVSACGQVSVFKARSKLKDAADFADRSPAKLAAEMDYAATLNRVLPPDIRVLAWCPVEDGFSARFDCYSRTYRYFFFAQGLDLRAMAAATARLVGTHDFRNFCKVDPVNVSNFTRAILQFGIHRAGGACASTTAQSSGSGDGGGSGSGGGEEAVSQRHHRGDLPFVCAAAGEEGCPVPPLPAAFTPSGDAERLRPRTVAPLSSICGSCGGGDGGGGGGGGGGGDDDSVLTREAWGPGDLMYFEICGRGFLWHQVRCMVAVLFLVGRRLEVPAVVDWLLDVDACPAAPAYSMASDAPLVFVGAAFQDPCKIDFSAYRAKRTQAYGSDALAVHFQRQAGRLRMKQAVAQCAMEVLGVPTGVHVPDQAYNGMGECMTGQSATKQGRAYVPLQCRPLRATLETRVSRLNATKRARYDARIQATDLRMSELAAAAAAQRDPSPGAVGSAAAAASGKEAAAAPIGGDGE